MFGFGRKALLDPETEKEIVHAIGEAEKDTRAEIRVHLARKIRKDVYHDAQVVFKKLGMHRTELRSAILIYVLPELHSFAIVGDIGIHQKVTDQFWQEVRDEMSEQFAHGGIGPGIITGIKRAGEQLKHYFPAGTNNPNEISNEISRS